MVKPILFNTDMVKAILDGYKTVTRRLIKPQPKNGNDVVLYDSFDAVDVGINGSLYKPPYQPGDILYVRETWQYAYDANDNDQLIMETGRYVYYADDPMPFGTWIDADTGEHKDFMPWKPSIHMPKEAARIFLRVTNVSVARIQDITTKDIQKEGLTSMAVFAGDKEIARQEWALLWDGTITGKDYNKYCFSSDPWVWVIEFERTEKPNEWV